MDMTQMATQLFLSKIGGSAGLNEDSVGNALSGLLPNQGGNLDIGGLVSQIGGGNLSSVVESWLGDGANDAVSGDNIKEILGSQQISSFASQLGIDSDTASQGLAGMIPDLVDKNSKGGSLLDSIGGAEGIANLAKKFF